MLTGDIVRIDADGYLTVVGRASDFIIRGGKNVSAAQVEHEVGSHPAVALVAAVAAPDELFGERVCVVRRAASRHTAELALDELTAHLAERGVSKEAWPEHLVVVDDLPRASGGKIAKGELRDGHQATARVMTRVAVLDDYQDVASTIVEWPAALEVVSFTDHVGDQDELVESLRGFDVVVAMRERTAFPRAVLERLPDLRLLVTTGLRNAAIDVEGGARARHRGLRHLGHRQQHGRADVGAHPRGGPPAARRGRRGAGRRLATGGRCRPRRQDTRAPRPRQHRLPGGTRRHRRSAWT